MFNWAKQQLANVAGTQEPVYGPSAIRSVAHEAEATPYTELTREDLAWRAMDSTSVENQLFYLYGDNGYIAFVQVIYSNVAGLKVTCQFNCKIMSPDASKPPLWRSTPLRNYEFSEDKTCFYADDCAVELSEDGSSFMVRSANDESALIDITVERVSPGFKAGISGTTNYGTDLKNPWGCMKHTFWPRCIAKGNIITPEGAIDFSGRALFIHALQGMKPHHAAATWNFVNFQGPTYSALGMEFTTPPSYGSTTVGVGCITKDDQILTAGCNMKATHTASSKDPKTNWPEPTEVKYAWSGSKDDKDIEGVIEGSLGTRVDRIDIMDEVPGFIKTIIAGAAGTRPYIYQYRPKLGLKMRVGEEEQTEEGTMYCEATFISDPRSGQADA